MSDALFQEAYARARNRFSEDAWLGLQPREITNAIYHEIRQIDAERAGHLRTVPQSVADAKSGTEPSYSH
jgi:hypothetical protein